MAVERENVETLREWLADGSPTRSAHLGAAMLVEKLAAVVFQGEWEWLSDVGRVDAHRDVLREWFAGDSGRERQFTELTSPDADPGLFIDWFLPVVLEWEDQATRDAADDVQDDGATTGWPNPNHDGTPGTEFYRTDDTTDEYLYSASPDGWDWATYEQRRYSEPAHHDEYRLDYRYDHRDGVYQWYDRATGTWNDQAWADRFATDARDEATGESADGQEHVWDDGWKMFHRTGPDGGHEFADAMTPGEQTSGCSREWLSHAQVLLRRSQESAGDPGDEAAASARAEVLAAVEAALEQDAEMRAVLSQDEIAEVVEELMQKAMGGQ